MQEILYLKLNRDVEIHRDVVQLSDLGKVVCRNKDVLARVKALRLLRMKKNRPGYCIISVMKIIETLQRMYPTLTIENIGETEVIVEWVKEKKASVWRQGVKTVFVSLICFFGSAFTLMAFHNDIGITEVFGRMYEMIVGTPSDGFTVLEGSYSIGLTVGIILFFNHIGGKKITKDMSPIQVEMRMYEESVNNAMVETADREGKMIDVS